MPDTEGRKERIDGTNLDPFPPDSRAPPSARTSGRSAGASRRRAMDHTLVSTNRLTAGTAPPCSRRSGLDLPPRQQRQQRFRLGVGLVQGFQDPGPFPEEGRQGELVAIRGGIVGHQHLHRVQPR